MKKEVTKFVHLHKNRSLYVMTVQAMVVTGWLKKQKNYFLENYVSMNGVAWSLMPGKERAEEHINDTLVAMFNDAKQWELIEDMHKGEF